MAGVKELQTHIQSVRDTKKVTNAMYLISSAKLRKARADWERTRPYFEALQAEIKRIFRTVGRIDSPYFYPSSGEHDLPGAYGYLVITSDKGLAGAYNQNVIKLLSAQLEKHKENRLFVVGKQGRMFFASRHIPVEQSFLYTAQNPTLDRAREIADTLLDFYDRGELSKIFVIYTDFKNGLEMEPKITRLLPFHHFEEFASEPPPSAPFEFEPSVEAVLTGVLPSYLTGFIYSALVDSFCCEQSARMTAMDAANRNAQDLLDELQAAYHHQRQSHITQEITEVSSGARALHRATQRRKEEATDDNG